MINIKDSNERFRSYTPMIIASCNVVNPKLIVEYGPGYSTDCFLNNSDAIINSWESHSSYYSKFNNKFLNNERVNIYLGDTRAGNGKKTPYINAPLITVGHNSVDIVFVDGRFRADCLIASSLLVNDMGVVILHDDERPSYQEGAKVF